ncbi:hypothetical protein EIN_054010 [Entamoeba invadens IP1]|uniref:hypothetical protein n=1 Tax=Entamoeba invadens IP1 TaxID=370355 RepID=UPI0002C3F432|nr:hypothetical protein EIN_054010 [Entamoeba invadens IP1]ELP93136.1 hypothetical protein EIN_054010 [Entamoeba invadens IP1]|eukprot:XP_004259907.1 hypothetical protein EIN_054010 [Entamoeba invadens IP1]
MKIVCLFMETEKDVEALVLICKKNRQLIESIEENPFSSKLFMTVKHQHLYKPTDPINPDAFSYHVEYPLGYEEAMNIKAKLSQQGQQVFLRKVELNQNDTKYFNPIPKEVSIFGEKCFSKRVKGRIDIMNNIFSMKDACFFSCYYLESIHLPKTLTFIGEECFKFCSSLKKIKMYDAVEYIGKECFCMCTSLQEISLPTSLTYLPNSCFYRCDTLTKVFIPNGITAVGDGCFNCCNILPELSLPTSVLSIGNECFRNCVLLSNLTLPDIKDIGINCFSNCKKLNKSESPLF